MSAWATGNKRSGISLWEGRSSSMSVTDKKYKENYHNNYALFLLPLPCKKDWRYRNQDWKQDSDRERNRNCNTWYKHYLKKTKQNKPFSNTDDVHRLPLRETGSAKRFSIVAVSPWLHYLGDSVSPWFHSRLPIHWSPCWSAVLSPLRSPVGPVHCEKATKSP